MLPYILANDQLQKNEKLHLNFGDVDQRSISRGIVYVGTSTVPDLASS